MMTGKNTIMYNKGDIVLVPFPLTDLSATKTRPAVIISDNDFQTTTGSLTVAMITSTSYSTPYDYQLKDWRDARLLCASWVRSKVVTIDPSIISFMPGKLTVNDLNEVMSRIKLSLGL